MFRQAINAGTEGQRQQRTIWSTRPTSQSTTGVPGPIITSKASPPSFPRDGQVVVGRLQATLLQPTPPSTLNRASPTINNIAPVRSGPPTPEVDRSGKGSQMQTAVFFQEDDFDDDIDLDLDVEDPATKDSVSQPLAELSATKSMELVATPADPLRDARLSSSAPLAWSSSPARPTTTLLPSAPIPKTTSSSSSVPGSTEPRPNDLEDANPRPRKKGRSLFWQQNDRDRTIDDDGDPPQDALRPDQTPVRTQSKTQQPWDQTASAVKENRRQLKEARKKSSRSVGPTAAAVVADTTRSSSRKAIGRVFLSDEQRAIMDMIIRQKKSVFFTGSAGTGKSVLLRELIRGLQGKYRNEPDRVAVTASTGLAACNVGGVTLHSFSGIGLGKESAPELIKKIKRNAKAKTRWLRTEVLIIDEVSMVDGEMFDKLEEVARKIRASGKPFGGIQLVITGDFFQLPPVPDQGRIARFAFEANTWSTTIERTIGLTQIFRQKDPVFAGMLNEMRLGRLTAKSIATFQSLSRPIQVEDDLDATELFSTRAEVDNANLSRLRMLPGSSVVFEARDGGTATDKVQRDRLLANCMAPASFELKKGAQVMLIKNLDESLVNGSLGKVVGFMDEAELEIFSRHGTEYELFEAMGPPAEELQKARIKSWAKLEPDQIKGTGRRWPYVRFTNADGTSRSILCQPEAWKIELPGGEVQASRSQVPLILAWALSIHKAQGQTLERVKVDLGRIFEKGQAYVALSRATSQEGLQVLRFDPKKVMAHDKVRQFYDGLYHEGAGEIGLPRAPPPPPSYYTSRLGMKPKSAPLPAPKFDDGHHDDDDDEEALRSSYG